MTTTTQKINNTIDTESMSAGIAELITGPVTTQIDQMREFMVELMDKQTQAFQKQIDTLKESNDKQIAMLEKQNEDLKAQLDMITTMKKPRKKKGTGKVSAYNMFSKNERSGIVEKICQEHPEIMVTSEDGTTKPDSKQLFKFYSKAASIAWKGLSEEDRKPYIDMAREENARRSDSEDDTSSEPETIPSTPEPATRPTTPPPAPKPRRSTRKKKTKKVKEETQEEIETNRRALELPVGPSQDEGNESSDTE